ncbi:MAG TPA: orotidine-5'-phosphate decarboxylase [Candidatus Tumulicola sp.]|nr:orotidine-5'-phosphate decarboxylase [Candidatus Tumulicola sp.]
MTQLIVALDEAGLEGAMRILDATAPDVRWYKVGYEGFYGYGPRIIEELHQRGKKIFLDLKLHDIPNTVAAGVRAIAQYRPSFLTVHAAGGQSMLAAAVAARDEVNAAGAGLKLLAVTLLTSHSKEDLRDIGVLREPHELVSIRSGLAAQVGLDGAVCAVDEVAIVQARANPDFIVVCPGIRPAGSDPGDQRRVATPTAAVLAGADYIVVGRPVTKAADPAAAARGILDEMASVHRLGGAGSSP